MAAQFLTDTKIKGEIANTKIGAERRSLRDSKARGLVLRITPKGRATWSLQYRPKGSTIPCRIMLGIYPEMGLADARSAVEVKRGEIARGIDPLTVRCKEEAVDARPTFGEVAQNFLRRRIPKEKNRRTVSSMFNTELLPVLGDMALEEIGRADILTIYRRISERGADSQAGHVCGYARAVLNYAVDKGLLSVSPLAGLKIGAASNPRERHLSVQEIRTFWTRLDTAPMQDAYKVIVRLQLLLGRRVSEVSGMARHEINMDTRLWTIPAERSKNWVEQKVPLPKLARDLIGAWLSRGAGSLLFPNTLGNPHDAKHIANSLRAAQAHFGFTNSAGKPNNFTTHDLRRTCGTYLRALKFGDDVRAAVLGHTFKETVMDRHYNHADISLEVRDALATWQSALQFILRGGDPFAPSAHDVNNVEERAERRFMQSVMRPGS